MVLTTTVQRSRKRPRRQGAPAGSLPTARMSLPQVNNAASATLARSQSATANTATRPSSPQPFIDNLDLDAQISTLSLINTYGYGPVPGTPLVRGKTASSSGTTGRSGTPVSRDFAAAGDATRGATSARKRANMRVRGPSQSIRKPWVGPIDSGTGLEGIQHARGSKVNFGIHGISCQRLAPDYANREIQ